MNKRIRAKLKRVKYYLRILSYRIDKARRNSTKKTIIINGFWRSGTTWLQKKVCVSVNGKSIFEPFSPHITTDSYYSNIGVKKSDLSNNFRHAYMPFFNSKSITRDFEAFLSSVLNATIKAPYARFLRSSMLASFKKTVVCKFVRGHLLLPYILEQNQGVPIIHIYRNPKAVISSIERNRWGYWLEDFCLSEHFLNIEDGRKAYFEKHAALIAKYDQLDSQSRICALWCLTEVYINDHCMSYKNFMKVSYESLVENGFNEIIGFLSGFGHKWTDNTIEKSSSKTTIKSRVNMSNKEKSSSWRQELSLQTQTKIDAIVTEFGLNLKDYE